LENLRKPRNFLGIAVQRTHRARSAQDKIFAYFALFAVKAYAVTGAVCLSAAAKVEGTLVNEIYKKVQPDNPPAVRIGHPTGKLQVEIEIEIQNGELALTKAALTRTARLLMDGNVYVR